MSANPLTLAPSAPPRDEDLTPEARTVRDALIEHGLETPMLDNGLTERQKYDRIRTLMTQVIETLGLDLRDDSLAETPHRIAKMYVHEIFSGLDYRQFPRLSLIENKAQFDRSRENVLDDLGRVVR